jgi:hypothetical protein
MSNSADNFYVAVADNIDRFLSLPFSDDIVTEVFELVDSYDDRKNYFLKKVDGLEWFFPLKARKYFSPDNAPGPKPVDATSYSIPYWNVLGYLERASQQLNDPKNEQYINEFLNIIDSITNYIDKNGHHIDNFYTWWSFVKFLLNIPNNKIPLKTIELIPIWLQSKFGTKLQGVDIAIKLLPKFLPENPAKDDIEKAEKIIDYITDIRPVIADGKQNKAYKRTKDYELVVDDYWLRQAVEKNADVIGKRCSKIVVDILSSKLRKLLKKETGRAVLEKDGITYLITVTEDDNQHILKVLLVEGEPNHYFFEDEKEGAILLNKLFPAGKRDDFIKGALNELKRLVPIKKINEDELKRRLHYAYFNLYDEGTYTSLYAEYDYPRSRPVEVLTDFLKRIMLSKAKDNVKETKEIICSFFADDYLYFQKMALFVIAENLDYVQLFWDQLACGDYKLIKDDLYFGDELNHLFKNIKHFSVEEKEILEKIIESGPEYYKAEEDRDKHVIPMWKQKRYEALIHDREFRELYEHYKTITGVDVQLRPAIGEFKTRWGSGKSHLTKEQIIQMPNEELSIFLSQAKNEDFWEGFQVRALADMLKAAVKDKPEKFTNDLSPFLKNGYMYIYEILWGLREVWRNKQSVDWGNLFYFIKQYLFQAEFWQDKYAMVKDDHFTANHQVVVGEVAELIEEGTRNDDWAFDESLLGSAEEIILNLLDNLKAERKKEPEEKEQFNDPITYALNSTFGKTLNAFINYSLRKARVEKKSGRPKKVKWAKIQKEKYEKTLADEIPEAFTLLGQYMPNFCFLDKNWVEKKIKEFEELDDNKLWSSFMYGYLFTGNFYEDLYRLMKNHYARALKTTLRGDRADERLVQHISLAYIRGLEDITEHGFFDILIKNWNVSQIEDVIELFYSVRGQIDKAASAEKTKGKQRIIQFWKLVYERYKNRQKINEDDKKIISKLSRLIVFLDEINSGNIELLMLSAEYVNIDFNSPQFIEHLDILKDKGKSIRYIGKLYLKMLDNFNPDFDQQHIISIIDYLFSQKDEEISDAQKICNIYGSRGIDFLRPLFDKYSKK